MPHTEAPSATAQIALNQICSQLTQASSTIRAELDRLTRELHTTSEERDILARQCTSLQTKLRVVQAEVSTEKRARQIAEEASRALRASLEDREKKLRADEEEIRRDREALAADLKRLAQQIDGTAARNERELSGIAFPEPTAGTRTLRDGMSLSASSFMHSFATH